MTGANSHRPEPGDDASISDIEKDIEATRAELGQTVSALSDKLDVKQRVSDKTSELKTKAQPAVPAAAAVAAVVLVVVGVIVWRRKR